MPPAFSFISWACAFRAGNNAPIFFSGPIGFPSGRGGLKWGLAQWACSSVILWGIVSLVKKSLHRHRPGFEPQCTSPFGKRAKAPKILGPSEPERQSLSLCYPSNLVVLASSTSGEKHLCVSVTLCRPPPHQDWGRAETAGSRFSRDDKVLGPQLGGNNYLETGLVQPPRRDTQAFIPAGMFGGKAPLRLAAQKTRPHAL
jgi:hypothetical protein